MKYTVYTDGATYNHKGVCGCGYVIITDNNYITSDSIRVEEIKNPKQAETISIGLAAAYLIDHIKLEKTDKVEFYVDSSSAIEFCEMHIGKKSSVACNVKQVINSILVLRRLGRLCQVSFEKIHGHKDRMNPNTFADRLAKLAIRRE